MGQTINLRPIYGWGWVSGSGESRDVPTVFSVKLYETAPGRWKGTVASPEHEFFEMVAELTQRHSEWDGDVNVRLRQGGSDDLYLAAGFAQVADHRSLSGAGLR